VCVPLFRRWPRCGDNRWKKVERWRRDGSGCRGIRATADRSRFVPGTERWPMRRTPLRRRRCNDLAWKSSLRAARAARVVPRGTCPGGFGRQRSEERGCSTWNNAGPLATHRPAACRLFHVEHTCGDAGIPDAKRRVFHVEQLPLGLDPGTPNGIDGVEATCGRVRGRVGGFRWMGSGQAVRCPPRPGGSPPHLRRERRRAGGSGPHRARVRSLRGGGGGGR
jgi:hypothetical protein